MSAHRVLDEGNKLRDLAAAPAESGVYRRTLSNNGNDVVPCAFVASSAS